MVGQLCGFLDDRTGGEACMVLLPTLLAPPPGHSSADHQPLGPATTMFCFVLKPLGMCIVCTWVPGDCSLRCAPAHG